MNHKSPKVITDKYAKELNNSNENNLAKDGIATSFKSFKPKIGGKIAESRPSTNLPESSRNLSDY